MQKFLNDFEEILDAFSPFYGNIIILFHFLNILYIIFTYLNINVLSPYVYQFNRIIQFFVCLFLLVKFHPFRKHVLREGESSVMKEPNEISASSDSLKQCPAVNTVR